MELQKAHGCKKSSFPYCERIAVVALSEAFVSSIKGCLKLGWINTSAWINLDFRFLNADFALVVHMKCWFFHIKAISNIATFE